VNTGNLKNGENKMPFIILKINIIFWFSFLIILIPLFFLYRFWYFFRDPKRAIPDGNNIIAPADGFIIYIREIKNNEVPVSVKKGEKITVEELSNSGSDFDLVIGIFMTPFSVHYNRFPFSGNIKKNVYRRSDANLSMSNSFLNLIFNLKPYSAGSKYIIQNERNTVVIENKDVNGAVVQIADKWVNKIKNIEIKENDNVNKGDKIGMIRMGSQCDLFLKIKKKYKIFVKERDYVKAGSSVLIEIVE
jgi:phosphatidylserine decarboxylase